MKIYHKISINRNWRYVLVFSDYHINIRKDDSRYLRVSIYYFI